MTERKRSRIETLAAALFFALCFLSSAYLAYRTSEYIFDSDASSELVLAELLSRQGGILSSDWFYSTELRVLNTQLVYAPLFHIFPEWRMVRFVGAVILQAILALSMLFCTRQAGVQRSVGLVCTGLLLLPLSVSYARIVLMHCYYIPHIAIGLFLTGLMLAALRGEKPARSRRWYLCGYLALSLVSGLGGLRQLMVTFLPLLVACGVLLLLWSEKKPLSLRPDCLRTRGFAYALLGSGFCAAGYFCNLKLLSKVYDFWDFSTTKLLPLRFEALEEHIQSLMSLFGYRTGVSPFSPVGLTGLAGAGLLLVCLVFSARLLRAAREEGPPYGLLLAGAQFPAALISTCPLMALSGWHETLYWIPVAALSPLLLAAVWTDAKKRGLRLRRAGLLLMTLCVCANAVVVEDYLVARHCGAEIKGSSLSYEGLNFSDIDQVRRMRPVTTFLVEQGYRYGYASFWNANICTEMTDGALRLIPLEFKGEQACYYAWLTARSEARAALLQEKVFLLLTSAESAHNRPAGLAQAQPVYDDGTYCIFDLPAGSFVPESPS